MWSMTTLTTSPGRADRSNLTHLLVLRVCPLEHTGTDEMLICLHVGLFSEPFKRLTGFSRFYFHNFFFQR